MNRELWILIAALMAGIAGFMISQRSCCSVVTGKTASANSSSKLPELEWLRSEFRLTDAEFTKTSELHLAYQPICDALCMKVMASHDKIKKLTHSGTQVSPELTAALQERAVLHVECQTAMLAHFYQTAACLSPEKARNYLDATLPQVIEMTMDAETTHGGH